ncbi:hypothetical protein CB1_064113026 [Camelus ferus]|nr:hypothetical protein CB1_064113026 [Camelus ferus]
MRLPISALISKKEPGTLTLETQGPIASTLMGSIAQSPHSRANLPVYSIPAPLMLYVFMGSGSREHLCDCHRWVLPGLTGGLAGKDEQQQASADSSKRPSATLERRTLLLGPLGFVGQQETNRDHLSGRKPEAEALGLDSRQVLTHGKSQQSSSSPCDCVFTFSLDDVFPSSREVLD